MTNLLCGPKDRDSSGQDQWRRASYNVASRNFPPKRYFGAIDILLQFSKTFSLLNVPRHFGRYKFEIPRFI